jgi:dihydroorotate dehydrogenase
MLYDAIRSALFQLDPETAHHLTLTTLQAASRLGPLNPFRQNVAPKPRSVLGLHFPNPVGLAAGLDKNGDCIDGLAALGFGFLEIGTVTPKPQPGNPKPRLFRLVEQQALINRLGFNNKGIEYLLERVRARHAEVILGINIGKNVFTPLENALDDYLIGLRQVYAHADYVTINLSSPNTPGLRKLQTGDTLGHLLAGLAAERARLAQTHDRHVPLLVKIAPDLEPDELPSLCGSLVRHRVDGVIATNTTLSRVGAESSIHAQEAGGLSGAPLMRPSTELVRRLSQTLGGELPIIACGGIMSPADARAKFDAGASLIQIYSGLIFKGPALIRAVVDSLS